MRGCESTVWNESGITYICNLFEPLPSHVTNPGILGIRKDHDLPKRFK